MRRRGLETSQWKLLAAAAGATVTIGVVTAAAAGTFELSAATANQINVTADSSPGWIPATDQRQRAIKTVEVFLNAIDGGHYAEAYGMLNEGLKRNQTLAQFIEDGQKFEAKAGAAKFWKALKVTWTKDSARAPFPGIFAAIDLTAQFANVDRCCGYIVLYQPAAGVNFTIIRREKNYIDNATARSIEEKKSKAELAKVWEQLSRYCPNYHSSGDAQ